MSYKYAGGGMISSAEDMVRLGVALNAGLLLKAASIEKMRTPYFEKNAKAVKPSNDPALVQQWQGLIWFIGKDQAGRSWYGHSGTVKGTRCFLINHPEEGLVLGIQANIGTIRIEEYGQALAQMYLASKSGD